MLQTNTVKKKTLELLIKLMDEPLLAETRLVGGTSLALQIGHRESTDLDLFYNSTLNIEKAVKMLSDKYNYSAQFVGPGTTIGFIDGIKIDIIKHDYDWLKEPKLEGNIRLAKLTDIAAMKIHAIINSGERPKDFVDIAFLSNYFPYTDCSHE